MTMTAKQGVLAIALGLIAASFVESAHAGEVENGSFDCQQKFFNPWSETVSTYDTSFKKTDDKVILVDDLYGRQEWSITATTKQGSYLDGVSDRGNQLKGTLSKSDGVVIFSIAHINNDGSYFGGETVLVRCKQRVEL